MAFRTTDILEHLASETGQGETWDEQTWLESLAERSRHEQKGAKDRQSRALSASPRGRARAFDPSSLED